MSTPQSPFYVTVTLTREQALDLASLLSKTTAAIQSAGIRKGDAAEVQRLTAPFNKWLEISKAVNTAAGFQSFSEPKRLNLPKPYNRIHVSVGDRSGYLVEPEDRAIVIFEWTGEGKKPEEIALDAFNNIQQADSRPVCTVLMPKGDQHTIDLEHVEAD